MNNKAIKASSLTEKKWRAIYSDFSKQGLGITGNYYRVLDVECGMENELGYTSSRKTIHLNHEHSILNDLSDVERISLIKGVYAHELLHQIFTDFASYERKLTFIPSYERSIFSIINNVLEDAAIENFADQVMGGTLLTSLNFSIAHIYKQSPNIEEASTAFGQYMSAMINFGDMGPLKGHFTFPEARRIFVKTAPIFERGVNEPVGENRINLAYQIMQISKPLWEEIAKENEAMEKLAEEISKHMKSNMRGSGSGRSADSSEGGKKNERRKITIKKVSKEELEEMKKNGEISDGSDGLPDGDITVLMCDEDTGDSDNGNSGSSISIPMDGKSGNSKKNDSKNTESSENSGSKSESNSGDNSDEDNDSNPGASGSSDGSDDNSDNPNNSDDSDKSTSANGDDNSDSEDSEKSDNGEKDGKSSDNSTEDETKDMSEKRYKSAESSGNNNPFTTSTGQNINAKVENESVPEGFEDSDDPNGIGEISEEEYELSEEDTKRIVEETNKAEKDFDAKEKEDSDAESAPLDEFDITSPKLGKKSCLNYKVTLPSNKDVVEEEYSQLLTRLNPGIKNLTTQLKRIFENDYEETEYRTSGRINLKRANSGRVTARVFDRRVSPRDKSNFAIEILVDESGSMCSGNKAKCARECCVALSEVFANLNIPCYIIGFTADTQRHDIVHNHYVTWKNNHNERLKLLNITARANNCDGYSIRYATEVLNKAKTENKLLIVLSDGQPAASNYYDGVADTKQAIRDAKKKVNVLGVAIGNSDTETIFYMYEKDFLHISNVDNMFSGLARQLQKMMKNWE